MASKPKTDGNTDTKKPRSSLSKAVAEDDIGAQIREAREALGLTQVGLASRTKIVDPKGEGISRTVIIGYESGAYKPGAREIRILCETLSVTPNWLLYRKEAPFESTQASMHFMRGRDEVTIAIRLAIAALLLKPHERDLIAALVLSLGGRTVGDARLSGLLGVASMISTTVRNELSRWAGVSEGDPIAVSELIEKVSASLSVNFGNKLQFDEEGEPIGGDWLYADPKRKTKKK